MAGTLRPSAGSTADHAARDATTTAAEGRRMIGMIVASGVDHQRPVDHIRKLESRR
jgi:hypothetical protein